MSREWGKGHAQLPSLTVMRLASECSIVFRTSKLAAMMQSVKPQTSVYKAAARY